MSNPENHVQTAMNAALATVQQSEIVRLDDGRTMAILADGPGKVRHVDMTMAHTLPPPVPSYVRQHVNVTDESSLIQYLNRFKNDNAVVFGDIENNAILGVIDYHHMPEANRPRNAEDTAKLDGAALVVPSPMLLAHSVRLALPFSQEWETWTGIDDLMLSQLDFVRFLEENAPDIIDPDTASLIETCRDLQALRKVTFQKAVRTNSNNAEHFEYVDETKANARGGVEVPTQFKLSIPVYFNGVACDIKAFLRWHLDDGVLKLGIKLYRAENIRQATFKEIMESVANATGLTTIHGKPDGLGLRI